MVLACAKETSPQNPFVCLPREHAGLVMNSVMNTLSPVSAEGYFHAECNLPVHRRWYMIGLTFEKSEIAVSLSVILFSECKVPCPLHLADWKMDDGGLTPR